MFIKVKYILFEKRGEKITNTVRLLHSGGMKNNTNNTNRTLFSII